jgi:hypothetical protein
VFLPGAGPDTALAEERHVSHPPFRAVPDPGPAAAYLLGHHGWMLYVWIRDCERLQGAEHETRADLIAELNEMDVAAVDLEGVTDRPERDELRAAIKALKDRVNSPQGAGPAVCDWMVIRSESDRLLRHVGPLRIWYDLGAAVGRYHLTAREQDYVDPLPEFRAVLDCARQVLADVGCSVPVLDALVELGSQTGPLGLRELLRRVVEEDLYGGEMSPGMDRAAVCSQLCRLHTLLHGQLAMLPRPSEPPAAAPAPAGQQEKPGPGRLVIDLSSGSATLDGKVYPNLDPGALRVLQALHDRQGDWVSSKELKEIVPKAHHEKTIQRWLGKLPRELGLLIRGQTGKGRRLILAAGRPELSGGHP